MNPEAIEAAAKACYEHQNGEGAWERCGDAWKRAYLEAAAAVYSHPVVPYLIREARAAELEAAAEEADTMASVSSYSGSEDDMESLLNTATRLRARAAAIRAGEA